MRLIGCLPVNLAAHSFEFCGLTSKLVAYTRFFSSLQINSRKLSSHFSGFFFFSFLIPRFRARTALRPTAALTHCDIPSYELNDMKSSLQSHEYVGEAPSRIPYQSPVLYGMHTEMPEWDSTMFHPVSGISDLKL